MLGEDLFARKQRTHTEEVPRITTHTHSQDHAHAHAQIDVFVYCMKDLVILVWIHDLGMFYFPIDSLITFVLPVFELIGLL